MGADERTHEMVVTSTEVMDVVPYCQGMRVVYNKLIRDRIPEIIRAAGDNPVTRTLDNHSYIEALLAKLLEEAHEAQVATTQELPLELADVLEVLMSIASAIGITWEQVLNLAAAKRSDRGGFEERLILEYVDRPG
jgi:predicted house-cleaning noncanonical NTP pyrophosphatase (MazG superfamily)